MTHRESTDGQTVFIPLEQTRLQLGDRIRFFPDSPKPFVERKKPIGEKRVQI